MAPVTLNSAGLELHESEITKPQPLRIIKRSQTISNCSSSRQIIHGGRSSSSSSEQSKGSPPMGLDWPVTVRKRRHGRSHRRSSFFGNMEVSDSDADSAALLDMLHGKNPKQANSSEDSETTPKAAKQIPRTISADAFLKSELHQCSPKICNTRYSVRGDRHSIQPRELFENYKPPMRTPPGIPERRPSKSKNFLLRALAGRGEQKPRSICFNDSRQYTPSKNPLIRRFSRDKKSSSACSDQYSEITVAKLPKKSSRNSLDIAKVPFNPRCPSLEDSSPSLSLSSMYTDLSTHGHRVYVLCPQVRITPEAPIVNAGDCSIWVAIEVRGVLERAVGNQEAEQRRYFSSQSINSQPPDPKIYGYLYSMMISIDAGKGCLISEIIGDHHEPKTVRVNETHLILTKIRFCKMMTPTHIRETSSDHLITELRTDLGDTLHPYVTVRLNYKHSGFPITKVRGTCNSGINSHTTRLQTEATAVIKRHNPQSAWSPRTSQSIGPSLAVNPIINLIETCFPVEEARHAIRKIAESQIQIPSARRFIQTNGLSEETVKADSSVTAGHESPSKPLEPVTLSHEDKARRRDVVDDIDPARKIWVEMRRNSRGGRLTTHTRKSISASHYLEYDEHNEHMNTSPCSLGHTSVCTAPAATSSSEVDQERVRIMEVALRNKRSMGAETLRSMAPSVQVRVRMNGSPRSKGESIGGLGLGVQRSWWMGLFQNT